MHVRAMQTEHEELHYTLAVLAPLKRFELLRLVLGGGERSVTDLAGAVGLSQSCTTRHLQALQRAGLVRGVREGKRVVFRPAREGPPAAGLVATLIATAGRPAPKRRERESALAGEPALKNASLELPGADPPSEPSTDPGGIDTLPPLSDIEDYLL